MNAINPAPYSTSFSDARWTPATARTAAHASAAWRMRVRVSSTPVSAVEPGGAPVDLLVHDERRQRHTGHETEPDRRGDRELHRRLAVVADVGGGRHDLHLAGAAGGLLEVGVLRAEGVGLQLRR